MATELLEIQPLELQFTFEVKKQSSCTVHLGNKSDQYVAFKVKTTSPKKYCVRPNIGIIKPKATSDFTVIMQAQRVAPPDMHCKDKFLIQSTAVAFGTTNEDTISDMFARGSGKYIEEKKLRVVLISSPKSPVLLTRNGELNQDLSHETSLQKERAVRGVENIPPGNSVADDAAESFQTAKGSERVGAFKDVQESETAKDTKDLRSAKEEQEFETAKVTKDLRPAKDVQEFEIAKDTKELRSAKDVQEFETAKDTKDLRAAKGVQEFEMAKDTDELTAAKDVQSRPANDAEALKPKKDLELAKDFEELRSKLSVTGSQLRKAEHTIMKLTEERSLATREKETLKNELDMLRMKSSVRKVQVGFPLLYVCMVALISLAAGYFSHR